MAKPIINQQLEEIRDAILGLPTSGVQEAVDEWLDDHPEATTTVQDGSLTYSKLVTGTLGYVTPEMYGAAGDGVSDDTQAINGAVQSGQPVYFEKTYKITATIQVTSDLYMFGKGAIYMPAADSTKSMFNVQTAGSVYCEGLRFYSERIKPNTNSMRSPESKMSNVIGFLINAVDVFTIARCSCENLEFDVKTTTPENGISTKAEIVMKDHRSKNYAICAYISNLEKFVVIGGVFQCYEFLGAGDHCFYGSENVNNVYIYRPIIRSYPETGTTADLHFYSSTNETGNNVLIDGATLYSNNFVATNYKGDIEIRNCAFYALSKEGASNTLNPFYFKDAGKYGRTSQIRVRNCYFSPRTSLQYYFILTNPVLFESCIFDGWTFMVAMTSGDSQGMNNFTFNNCTIKARDTDGAAMFFGPAGITLDFEIDVNNSNCYQKLADGLAVLAAQSGVHTIAFYNCHLKREQNKPYLDYAAQGNGTYKFFNCCSEYGKIRGTGEAATFVNVNNGFAQ